MNGVKVLLQSGFLEDRNRFVGGRDGWLRGWDNQFDEVRMVDEE